ncbi:hypothetical protein KC338_g15 [Hortaea werneckii]|nr:hypothetical protein KC338_g15 [Hortaea werneckii]
MPCSKINNPYAPGTPPQTGLHLLGALDALLRLLDRLATVIGTIQRLNKRDQRIHHRPIPQPRLGVLAQGIQRRLEGLGHTGIGGQGAGERGEVDAVQRARGAAHVDFELGDELGDLLGELGEVFAFDEG